MEVVLIFHIVSLQQIHTDIRNLLAERHASEKDDPSNHDRYRTSTLPPRKA